VIVLPLDVTDEAIMRKAKEAYRELQELGIAVLLDDRDERAGVKFKDADLLGISLQLIIGKESLKKDTLELKVRRGNKKILDRESLILRHVKENLNV
jgi:prolyl-tRNA synthetase